MSGALINISHSSMKYSLNQQIACFLLIFALPPHEHQATVARLRKQMAILQCRGRVALKQTDGIYSLFKNQ